MYGGDDMKIIVYNIERWLTGKALEKHKRGKPLGTTH